MARYRRNSLREPLPHPSAMLDGIETAALRSCDASACCSILGIVRDARTTSQARTTPRRQTSRSTKLVTGRRSFAGPLLEIPTLIIEDALLEFKTRPRVLAHISSLIAH